MENYYVYLHTNTINKKVYVGMTKLTPIARWGSNGGGYRHQSRFYNDILKYGWDNFTHEILHSGLTKEEAQAKEHELIVQLDSANPDKGYNTNTSRRLAKMLGDEQPTKMIYCQELDKCFRYLREAAEAVIGGDTSTISKACRGIRATAGKHPETGAKLHWRYVEIA